jgi:hypothetical protein
MTSSTRDKIDVLLAEHSHIWEQMNMRISAGMVNISNVSLILTVFIVAAIQFNYKPIFVIMPLLVGVFVSVEIVRQAYVLALGRYITRLEQKINELAGEELLMWDSRVTLGRIGRGLVITDPYSKRRVFNPLAASGLMVLILSLASYTYSVYEGVVYLWTLHQVAGWAFLGISILLFFILLASWISATYSLPPFYERFIEQVGKHSTTKQNL